MDLIGKMDKVVIFWVNNPDPSGAGNRDEYTAAVTTRGAFQYGSGARDGSYADIMGNQSARLIVRIQDAVTAILGMSVKVQIGLQMWAVQDYHDMDEGNMYYKFSLTRQQNG